MNQELDPASQFDLDAELGQMLRRLLPAVENECRRLEEEGVSWVSGQEVVSLAVVGLRQALDSGSSETASGYLNAFDQVASSVEEDQAEILAWALEDYLSSEQLQGICDDIVGDLSELMAHMGH
jgi:hypothetical protein